MQGPASYGIKYTKATKSLLHTQGLFPEGHLELITCLALTSDNLSLLSSSFDFTIRLWSFPSLNQLHIFSGHQDAVNGLSLTRSNTTLISASDDKTIRIWSLPNRILEHIILGHTSYVTCIALSHNDSFIISGSGCLHNREDITVRVWGLKDRTQRRIFKGHKLRVACLASSGEGRLIASGADDCNVRIWDLRKRRLWKKFKGHESCVTCVSFAGSGKLVVSGALDYTVRVWGIRNGQQVFCFQCRAHKGIRCIALSKDEKYVISGSDEIKGFLMNLNSESVSDCGEEEGIEEQKEEKENEEAKEEEEGEEREEEEREEEEEEEEEKKEDRKFISSSILIWNIRKQTLVGGINGVRSGVTSVAVSSDGKQIVASFKDKRISVFDYESQSLVCKSKCHTERIKLIGYVGNELIVTAGKDNCIIVWNLKTKLQEAIFSYKESKIAWLGCFCSEEVKYCASYQAHGKFICWDLKEIKRCGEFITANLNNFRITLNGKYIAAIHCRRYIHVFKICISLSKSNMNLDC